MLIPIAILSAVLGILAGRCSISSRERCTAIQDTIDAVSKMLVSVGAPEGVALRTASQLLSGDYRQVEKAVGVLKRYGVDRDVLKLIGSVSRNISGGGYSGKQG